ncbi:MAG: hypothetical protein ABR936_16150 [Bacteroidota bacterium]|jgi:hypothetical protein
MIYLLLVSVLSLSFSTALITNTIQFTDGTVIKFASIKEGKKLLTTKDDFIFSMSSFDRSARMKTDKDISENEFLSFISESIVDWKDEEIKYLLPVISSISMKIKKYNLSLPDTIFIIKTSGIEEGGAAYTRQNAIIFPETYFHESSENLEKTFAHELFHVFTRHSPDIKNKLYRLIGFEQCNDIILPNDIIDIKITNPDAPKNDHYIEINYKGNDIKVIPILFSQSRKYDKALGGEFFNYMVFNFIAVENQDGNYKFKTQDDKPILIGVNQISGFLEKTGRNTEYIIHPEEILADNFALLVRGDLNLPSPEIIKKIGEELLKH